jgi:CheY-like chemotaxis protein
MFRETDRCAFVTGCDACRSPFGKVNPCLMCAVTSARIPHYNVSFVSYRMLAPAERESRCFMRKKILVVDDSSTVTLMQRMVLNRHAFDVVVANDGEEAIGMAKREHPDLILMDVVMPKMNGFDACRLIRQDESIRNVPIIMVTTRGEGTNIERGFESGCNDYVTKPINHTELLTKIHACIAG